MFLTKALKLLKNFNKVIIQPITGNLKSGDFKSKVVEKVYKKFISKISIRDQKKIFFHSLKINAYYGGPREALLHGLIRKKFKLYPYIYWARSRWCRKFL